MDAQIIFAGLCSFLNLDRAKPNPKMPEPSVILVRSSGAGGHQGNDHMGMADGAREAMGTKPGGAGTVSQASQHGANIRAEWYVDSVAHISSVEVDSTVKIAFTDHPTTPGNPAPPPPAPSPEVKHIAFIAFNSDDVTVDPPTDFIPVKGAENFQYLPLDGVELKIKDDTDGNLLIDPNYSQVACKDAFWPGAIDKWDRHFVPAPRVGKACLQPSKSAVTVFMRFGSGKIAAGKSTSEKWRFLIDDDVQRNEFYGGVAGTNFAREVVYSDIRNRGSVTIVVSDIESGAPATTPERTFKPKDGRTQMMLFIGNNVEPDIANVVLRKDVETASQGDHFIYLNRIAGVSSVGPLPKRVSGTPVAGVKGETPGGGQNGYCGPDNGNGG
jgi:hypothetical protein